MLQLFTTLRSLTALEHFDLKSDQALLLPELFKAWNECALTHFALSSCKLAGLLQDCDLPSSLEVVDLAYNPALYTQGEMVVAYVNAASLARYQYPRQHRNPGSPWQFGDIQRPDFCCVAGISVVGFGCGHGKASTDA